MTRPVQTWDLDILAVGGRNEDHGGSLAHEIGLRALDNARGRSAATGDHVDAGGDVPCCATLRAAAGFYFALRQPITRDRVTPGLSLYRLTSPHGTSRQVKRSETGREEM